MKRLIAIFISCIGLLSSSYAQDVKTYIPPQAFRFFDTINIELLKYFPELKYRHFIPGLIEHESCISLKHSKCWNSRSELNTKRELGVGLGQITKTYREDGSIRFDSLEGMKRKHTEALNELAWSNVRERPDLQIRAIVLMNRDNYIALTSVKDPIQRTIMLAPSYNGGIGGLQNERRACGMAKDCDPNVWFNNVENYCLKSKKILYGNRNACDINRHHAKDVVFNRMPKYKEHF